MPSNACRARRPSGAHRRTRAPLTVVAIAGALLSPHALSGCSDRASAGLACPVLAPGATAALTAGATVHPLSTPVETRGTLTTGGLAAHPLPLPPDARVQVSATVAGSEAVLMVYGPRDAHGGYAACSDLQVGSGAGLAASLVLAAPDPGGEYLVVVGARPGQPPAPTTPYTLHVTCTEGCDAGAVECPSLAELGCAHARCDGALGRDERGCLTCACADDRSCDPEHRPGPWGACVSPQCQCEGSDGLAVCGADGNTWSSRCEALCAGVAPLHDGSCASSCPGSPDDPDASCDAPCQGPRALDATGCPTCSCAPQLPAAPVDCAACDDAEAPVCGSDGVTYRNPCRARCAGARILYAASCVDGCRRPPPGCDLDCAWGLLLTGSPSSCTTCTCAPAPPADCPTSGATVCAQLPALGGEATTGSPCMALRLGAADAKWGPCALPCQTAADCPLTADAGQAGSGVPDVCALEGRLEGRCLVPTPPPCGCSSLHEPVCGEDGETYANACVAHCAGVSVAQEGACCGTSVPVCAQGEVPALDARGCPSEDAPCHPTEAACLPPGEFDAPGACAPDGAPFAPPKTACEAHAMGLVASPRWCDR